MIGGVVPTVNESLRQSINIMRSFRVFISYASANLNTVERIKEILTGLELTPVMDTGLLAGREFGDELRKMIAQAHLFMPLITRESLSRPWVHQEIGYALGIDVPVLPLALGAVPGEMLAGVHALRVDSDLSNLSEAILKTNLEELVLPRISRNELERLGITTKVAEFGEERTRALVDAANRVPCSSRVRQRAFFSSFSLPDAFPTDPAWDAIELTGRRSEYYRTLLRDERRTLEQHAREGGCSLILYPHVDPGLVDVHVHLSQLATLRKFLVSMPNDKIAIAIIPGGFSGNMTVVGDWFGTKSLPPQPGHEIRQTLFTHHGPTVLRWVRDFDDELESHLREQGFGARESRDHAIALLDARVQELKTAPRRA